MKGETGISQRGRKWTVSPGVSFCVSRKREVYMGGAPLTFPPSCSCSCCRPWIPGWPAGSSSSSSPLPARFRCFSEQCSVIFYLLLLQRQKFKGITVLSPLPFYRTGQPAARDCQCEELERGRVLKPTQKKGF